MLFYSWCSILVDSSQWNQFESLDDLEPTQSIDKLYNWYNISTELCWIRNKNKTLCQ
jgi:hypothetical protein